MGSHFSRLFREYYAIHETIHTILRENNGAAVAASEIERRVHEAHPQLHMEPATLAAAIKQAAKDARVMLSEEAAPVPASSASDVQAESNRNAA